MAEEKKKRQSIAEIEKIRNGSDFKKLGIISPSSIKLPSEQFLRRKELPETIQALLGKETDPIIRFIDTTIALSNIKYKGHMLYAISESLGGTNFIKNEATEAEINSGEYRLVKDKFSPLNGRYVSRILSDNTLQLEFGAGLSQNKTDDQIIPTPDNIQLGLVPGISLLTNNYNEASVMFTQEYGLVPSGSFNISYLVGGGITSNVPANDLTIINTAGVYFKNTTPPFPLAVDTVLNSIVSTNPFPSIGGRNGDTVDEIRQNALNAYSTQLRAVTKDDYIIRTLSLPANYGNIAKAYISQDFNKSIQQTVALTSPNNPLALDLYVLSYNSNKQLTQASNTLKNNLITYLNQYRMVTDAINIKDAFYINIGVNFDITTLSGFSNKDVLAACISSLQNYFNIDKWQINQPIILSDIQSELLQIRGVKSIVKLEITNKQDNTGTTYSQYGYDIAGATKQGNIYPSLDPAIFEVSLTILTYPVSHLRL